MSQSSALDDNAQWLPLTNAILIGLAVRKEPFVSLDALAHEFGHAVASGFHNDIRTEGESGAINEHLADAWAVFSEYRLKSEEDLVGSPPWEVRRSHIWTYGEELVDFAPGFERSLARPYTRTDLGFEHPCHMDERLPTVWANEGNDWGYTHMNNGILNKWLYLWVNGGRNEHIGRVPPHDSVQVRGLVQRFGQTATGYDDRCIRIAEWAYLDLVKNLHTNSNPTFADFRVRMLNSIARTPRYGWAACTDAEAREAGEAAEQAFDAVGLLPHHP